MLARALRVLFLVVFGTYLIILASAYFSYIEPYLFPLRLIQGSARSLTDNIIIGPYPRESDIEKLIKIKGITVVVSLLNPNIPFEDSLLEREKEILSERKITFYNVPFSFINLDSEDNLLAVSRVKEIIAKHKDEKIYIHCYLGRHRVNFLAKQLFGKGK